MRESETIGTFVVKNREKTLAYLRNRFTSLSIQDTEDVFQEASIVLFCKECKGVLKSLTCELYTYFLRICINLSLKLVSGQSRRVMLALSDGQGRVSMEVVEQVLQSNEVSSGYGERKSQLMDRIMSELPEKSRNLMVGHYIEGRDWKDVARACGLSSAESAKSLACRCRRRIKQKYKKLVNEVFA